MTLLGIDLHLKDTPAEHKQTHAGMAYFAGTGPGLTTCRSCQFWSNDVPGKEPAPTQKSASCLEYKRLMQGKVGPKVPSDARACKHYQKRGRNV